MNAGAVYVALSLAAVVALYFAIVRLLGRNAVSRGEHQVVLDERDRLRQELLDERDAGRRLAGDANLLAGRAAALDAEREGDAKRIGDLEADLKEVRARLEAEIGRAKSAETKMQSLEQALNAAQSAALEKSKKIEELREATSTLEARLAEASANLSHSLRGQEEMKAFLDEAQSKLVATFTHLAGNTFEQKAQVFEAKVEASNVRSRSDLDSLLRPFAERLAEFRQRVDQVYGDEAKERSALFGAVNELKTLNQEMATQASALTRALKGSSKVHGDWGELMLESVLRGSGLEDGIHFERQSSSTAEDGDRLQPDIVIRLPDDRKIVIDSKVNLLAWQDAMNAEQPDLYQDAMRRHCVALRQHVRDLGEKNYPKAVGPSALEITIAFVPIEGALSSALGYDPSLQAEAFERRIAFASPNTLMAILRVVERLWNRDRVQKHALDISDAGGKVVDAIIRFAEEFDAVGKKLRDATDAFSAARNSLSDSPRALIPRARRLVELGAKGKRPVPAELQSETAIEADVAPMVISQAVPIPKIAEAID